MTSLHALRYLEMADYYYTIIITANVAASLWYQDKQEGVTEKLLNPWKYINSTKSMDVHTEQNNSEIEKQTIFSFKWTEWE